MSHAIETADPATLSGPQRALHCDKRGDWKGAHDAAQAANDTNSAWVHAYLHRKEGDQWNAEYWYRRAGRPIYRGAHEAEWQEIADALFPG